MRLNKSCINKGVAVVWLDHWESYDSGTAQELSENSKPCVGIARGTLVSYDKETVIIASNY